MAELSRSLQHVNCPESTWDMLICLSFRAEKTSHFFLIKEEPSDTPTCTKVEAETQLGLSGVKTRRQPVPWRCLSDTTLDIDHRPPRTDRPASRARSAAEEPEQRAPLSELQ
ncbi:hypothetical protein PFLUV_G00143490 [Perca fluviatilis]|uniref:Uncharacterized protein n=1 Tax=Perca fluviatilis TaxID=8168 RepID=A0A6A5EVP1_PERFL|nr:hypothetical protein PFLUV_G00143490 [Perca fluviatilis]